MNATLRSIVVSPGKIEISSRPLTAMKPADFSGLPAIILMCVISCSTTDKLKVVSNSIATRLSLLTLIQRPARSS